MTKRYEKWHNKGEVVVERDSNGHFVGKIIYKRYRPELFEQEYRAFEEEIIERENDEYVYFVGVDYDSPKSRKGHDFHTEFKVISPEKLTESEIRNIIQSKMSDYGNVLSSSEYEIKSDNEDSPNKAKHKPSFDVQFTQKIRRK